MFSKRFFVVVASAMAIIALSVVMLVSLTGCDEDCEGDHCGYSPATGKYKECCNGYECVESSPGSNSGYCEEE